MGEHTYGKVTLTKKLYDQLIFRVKELEEEIETLKLDILEEQQRNG